MTNYFRITAYHPTEDLSAIFDSYGMFGELTQFASFFTKKGFELIAVSENDEILDGNIKRTETVTDNVILRANAAGRPEHTVYEYNGIRYHAIQVEDKIYVPDKEKTVAAAVANANPAIAREQTITTTVTTSATNPVITMSGNKAVTASGNNSAVAAPANKDPGGYLNRYRQIKAENPGTVLFYRVGDFYEALSPDAETVSAMLGLTLVSRDFGADRVPMCGVPYHTVETYIKKLTDFGFKVALAKPQ